jgi:flagellar basal body P-ring protein FlgI
MDVQQKKIVCLVSILLIGTLIGGCSIPAPMQPQSKHVVEKSLGVTIGSLVEVSLADAIRLEGYSLVGGLNGTGSTQCPPDIKIYLKQYFLKQLPEQKDVEKLIDSHDTAVVLVQGIIPKGASKDQRIDLTVFALPGTQTTSLEGGWLYTTDLYEVGRFGSAVKALAKAEGPIFINKITPSKPNKRVGYVLGGGRVLDEYKIALLLRQADYKVASLIRNRLNERFGDDVAKALSPSLIELQAPSKYKNQKERFISIVKATYLTQTEEITSERIKTLISELAASKDKETAEAALEAIGNRSLDKLAILLRSSDEQIRFRTARCMLNLGSDQGLGTLREIVLDGNSPYRLQALDAITTAARRNDAAAISRRLLRDSDFNIRLAAYESLRKLDDIAITQTSVGHSFLLEEVAQAKYKEIFVARSGQPRIVLFGELYCRDNIFLQSADGDVTIDSPAGQNYVTVIRTLPKRPNVLTLKSSFKLADIILTLCEESTKKSANESPGLNVPYHDMVAILEQMVEKGLVDAEFRVGPLPEIDLNIKSNVAPSR